MLQHAEAGHDRGFALKLPNETSAVEAARLALLAYFSRFDLPTKVINRVEVVAEELIGNIVRHSSGARCIAIKADCADGPVHLAVSDDGAEFDPLDRPEPASFSTLDDTELGGLGVPLIKRLTKSVGYSRTDGQNRIEVTFAAD